MIIQRDRYLKLLIDRIDNGLIKVVTGIRCCGKSFLLFTLFTEYLKANGIPEDHIVQIALEDDLNEKYRDPHELSKYIRSLIKDSRKYYILLDEIQFAIPREELRNPDAPVKIYSVLNGLLRLPNTDIYVTGSNSKMLSTDIMTEFRGRGDVVEIHPLSFSEYFSHVGGDKISAFEDYALFGGMPLVLSQKTDKAKFKYLSGLFQEVYYKDIQERYSVRHPETLAELTDVLCSSVGSLTNVSKLTRTLCSVKGAKFTEEMIGAYLGYLSDAYLFRVAKRYDVKGKKYFEFPVKYYCEDIGLRNVRQNLRHQEETHIMENILFNELIFRGYSVDVGVIRKMEMDKNGKRSQKTFEIDFIVNAGGSKYYIQSALSLPTPEKQNQAIRPLLAVKDFFQRIIVSKTTMRPWVDEFGIRHIGLYDFLLNETLLEQNH